MGCIGSPNYLDLSPYKISSSSQKAPKSFTSHWFLIQVLSSILDLSSFGKSKQIYFSSENMVTNGWFKMYLNQEQFKFLEYSTYFKLYPIESKNKVYTSRSIDDSGYYVHASKDWTPPPDVRVLSRISDTIFYVENLIIDNEIQNDPRILKIRPSGTKQSLNRFVSGFLQSGHQKSIYSNSIYAPIRPLHNIGLNGTNQIVNVVDSGVDVFNAFFYDPNPENNLSSITGKTNVNHRKVVRIEPIVDNTDEKKGHGTHVAGTACGSAFCTNSNCGISQYNGIAPESKLYFTDIGNSTSGDLSGTVDLNEQWEIFKQLDVQVSSNSWGYSYSNKEIEFNYNKAAYEHTDVLYVFAAGNSQGYNTINCPGNTKNVLSVSAASFVSSAYLYYAQNRIEIQDESLTILINGLEITDSIVFNKCVDEKMKYYLNLTLKPYIEGEMSEQNLSGSVIVLNNVTGFDDKICERALEVEGLGAEAAIFVTDETEFYCDRPEPRIPTIKLVNKQNISELFNMKKVSLLPYSGTEKQIPGADLMSSKGPADSGLRKPDITIPGARVFSACSHGPDLEEVEITTDYSESIAMMSGSSMATPAASGSALIILQYLKEGFYPSLTKNSENSIKNVSSCLLRALLINTAIKPAPADDESKSLPRNDVGFGTPFLHKILGFNDTGLRFVDNEKIGQNSHRVYRIKLDSNSADLSVTLVYLDPPLDVDNEAILFADLDLYVKSPSGQIYNGNNVSDGDTLSVIEKVVFDKDEIPSDGGEFEIHIVSNRFPIESQEVLYSIVVNGPFDMKNVDSNPLFLSAENAPQNECPNDCSGNGKCLNGRCKCNDSFVGLSCGTKIIELEDGSSHSETLVHGDLRYFRIPLSEKVEKINFDIVKSYRNGAVYFCTSFEDLPEKLTDSAWTCSLACPKTDPDAKNPPAFANYSFETPQNRPKFFNLAIYTGYYKNQTIGLNNIKLEQKETPETSESENPPPVTKTQTQTATETQTQTATETQTQTQTATETQTQTATASSSSASSSPSLSLSQSVSVSESASSYDVENRSDWSAPVIFGVALACTLVVVAILIVIFTVCIKKRVGGGGDEELKSSMSMNLISNNDF